MAVPKVGGGEGETVPGGPMPDQKGWASNSGIANALTPTAVCAILSSGYESPGRFGTTSKETNLGAEPGFFCLTGPPHRPVSS